MMMDFEELKKQVVEEAVQNGELGSIFQNSCFEFDFQLGMEVFESKLGRHKAMNYNDCTPLSQLLK